MKRIFDVDGVSLCGPSFFLIAGPCVIEEEYLTLKIAEKLRILTAELKIPFIFKASFDKANRSSIHSFRGPGLKRGLEILAKVKQRLGVPVLSDVHETCQVEDAAAVLSMIQIPAFLSRQTDLLQAAGRTGLPINIKKSQTMAPEDMFLAAKKIEETGNRHIVLTERGTFFGYRNLVVDFRSIPVMKTSGYPVVLDAGHCIQQPSASEGISGGMPEFIPQMAACGIVSGADGIFLETHPEPNRALSDKHSSLELKKLKPLLIRLKKLYNNR